MTNADFNLLDADDTDNADLKGCAIHTGISHRRKKNPRHPCHPCLKDYLHAEGDGRMKGRDYYTEFAKALPKDTVILTAGCAKYRYNKLPLGDINGIPRVLDAGQCNDSYSLAVIAMKLKEVFELNDINELPIVYNIAGTSRKPLSYCWPC